MSSSNTIFFTRSGMFRSILGMKRPSPKILKLRNLITDYSAQDLELGKTPWLGSWRGGGGRIAPARNERA